VAEIRAMLSGHDGGNLRDRQGSIHDGTQVKGGLHALKQFDVPVSEELIKRENAVSWKVVAP